ncbi:MAG: CopG family transcriptional regulator [Gammaproteobacteria bacterium]
MSKDKILNIRIDPELKKVAKKVAESDHRSLSNWVTWLIQREVKRSGKKTR